MASKIQNKTAGPIAVPSSPSKKSAEASMSGAMPPNVILLPGDNTVVPEREKIPLDKQNQPTLGFVVQSDWDAVKNGPVVKAYLELGKIVEVA